MLDLTDYTESEMIELWEERSAVYEYDGMLDRKDAQYRAAVDVKRMLGKPLPQRIIDQSIRFTPVADTEQQS